MKKFLLIAVLLLAGCASIEVELPTGEKVRYSRVGNQKINMVVEKTDSGIKAGLEQQSELTVLTELAKAINKLSSLK